MLRLLLVLLVVTSFGCDNLVGPVVEEQLHLDVGVVNQDTIAAIYIYDRAETGYLHARIIIGEGLPVEAVIEGGPYRFHTYYAHGGTPAPVYIHADNGIGDVIDCIWPDQPNGKKVC